MENDGPVTTVAQVDLQLYFGTWFEICRLPMKWEDETATDITATYSLNDDGSVRVDNRCLNAEGKPTQAVGRAEPIDDSNARLTVTFLPEYLRWIPFTKGDYWILGLEPAYRIALVGSPDRKFLWLLARQPSLPPDVEADWLARARYQGFDLTHLIQPRQSGQCVTDKMLEQASN